MSQNAKRKAPLSFLPISLEEVGRRQPADFLNQRWSVHFQPKSSELLGHNLRVVAALAGFRGAWDWEASATGSFGDRGR